LAYYTTVQQLEPPSPLPSMPRPRRGYPRVSGAHFLHPTVQAALLNFDNGVAVSEAEISFIASDRVLPHLLTKLRGPLPGGVPLQREPQERSRSRSPRRAGDVEDGANGFPYRCEDSCDECGFLAITWCIGCCSWAHPSCRCRCTSGIPATAPPVPPGLERAGRQLWWDHGSARRLTAPLQPIQAIPTCWTRHVHGDTEATLLHDAISHAVMRRSLHSLERLAGVLATPMPQFLHVTEDRLRMVQMMAQDLSDWLRNRAEGLPSPSIWDA
jgi:hypothetical protein